MATFKSGRGGKRAGAGRKPSTQKVAPSGVPAVTSNQDVVWHWWDSELTSASPRGEFKVYVVDRLIQRLVERGLALELVHVMAAFDELPRMSIEDYSDLVYVVATLAYMNAQSTELKSRAESVASLDANQTKDADFSPPSPHRAEGMPAGEALPDWEYLCDRTDSLVSDEDASAACKALDTLFEGL